MQLAYADLRCSPRSPPHFVQAAKSILKTDFVDGMSIDDALKLSVKVLGKTMDTTSPSAEKMEFTVLRRCTYLICCCALASHALALRPLRTADPQLYRPSSLLDLYAGRARRSCATALATPRRRSCWRASKQRKRRRGTCSVADLLPMP